MTDRVGVALHVSSVVQPSIEPVIDVYRRARIDRQSARGRVRITICTCRVKGAQLFEHLLCAGRFHIAGAQKVGNVPGPALPTESGTNFLAGAQTHPERDAGEDAAEVRKIRRKLPKNHRVVVAHRPIAVQRVCLHARRRCRLEISTTLTAATRSSAPTTLVALMVAAQRFVAAPGPPASPSPPTPATAAATAAAATAAATASASLTPASPAAPATAARGLGIGVHGRAAAGDRAAAKGARQIWGEYEGGMRGRRAAVSAHTLR